MSGEQIGPETEVWLGDRSVAGEEFIEALNAAQDMQEAIREFQQEMEALDVGLDREDAVALIWGRTSLNKGQIERSFEVMDIIADKELDTMAPRLMADQCGSLTIAEAGEVWDEIVTLAEKYGDDDA